MTRYTITFTGRVQGVGFRYTTERIARRFQVAGWVRNEPDGSVRCVVEGEQADLDAFLAAVKDAMQRNIENARIEAGPAGGDLRGFEIRR
jgi:acylphosphatase